MAPQLVWCSQRRCLYEGSAFAEEVSVRVICGVAVILAFAEEVSV